MSNGKIVVNSTTARKIVSSLQELKEEVASLKKILTDRVITENGFTPDLENRVVASSKEPVSKSKDWNGKGSFTASVIKDR